ncbi:uncharacterized protein EURHEDRAFT_400832 [Aspergillus ruber CBS 135680]|uniref:Uncharacterized protein n=1 Tax=Aspergillus ruber (strain CBS 135680) TaxID=1388766 RepID=A0A017SLB2_ASPRC|nr:uncharacterized protein EURHEDRAFT_400832 [Aspergillus ruber CBS 135680]EYE97060.1 hypothetical protein EURHEDRAFT_400832 [Aspergillus ruber CBS 135680]
MPSQLSNPSLSQIMGSTSKYRPRHIGVPAQTTSTRELIATNPRKNFAYGRNCRFRGPTGSRYHIATLLNLQPNVTVSIPASLWTSPISHLPSSTPLFTEQATKMAHRNNQRKSSRASPKGTSFSPQKPMPPPTNPALALAPMAPMDYRTPYANLLLSNDERF